MTVYEELLIRKYLSDLITLGLWEQAIIRSSEFFEVFDICLDHKGTIKLFWTGPKNQKREWNHQAIVTAWQKSDYETYGNM